MFWPNKSLSRTQDRIWGNIFQPKSFWLFLDVLNGALYGEIDDHKAIITVSVDPYFENRSHICMAGLFCFLWRCGPTRAMASSLLRFLDHTQRRITVGRTPLGELSARRRDLYLTTHNTHNRHTSMTPVGFEPTISAGERPQTYALDHAANGNVRRVDR